MFDNKNDFQYNSYIIVFLLLLCSLLFNRRGMIMDKITNCFSNLAQKLDLDYGSGLVDIYFYGYLKVILPDLGTQKLKGIEDRIKLYIKEETLSNEVFPVHKIFLLVPSSGYSGPDISNFPTANGRIEYCKNLIEEPVISRSGVTRRNIQSSVYQINYVTEENKKKHIFVVMEAVPCLRSLYESCKSNPSLKALSPKIIRRVLIRLQQMLDENHDCRNKCVIIYCNNDADKNFSLPDEIIGVVNRNRNNHTTSNSAVNPTTETFSEFLLEVLSILNKLLRNKLYKWIYHMNERHGLSYGKALADTYFYGYLKIVLPDIGTNDLKGIVERTKDYKSHYGLTDEEFPVHKLFLLVTSSGYCTPDITNFPNSSGRIKLKENLVEEPVIDRSGIKKRSYKTSIYNVYNKDWDKKVFVVMEAAPCLMQLWDASKSNLVLKRFSSIIIKDFIDSLQTLLDEHEDCRDKCEIVPCNEDADDFILPDEILRRIKAKSR